MRNYIVAVPQRAVQFYIVKANSAAEAKRKARYGETDDGEVEPLDYRVTHTYEPSHARLDEEPTHG